MIKCLSQEKVHCQIYWIQELKLLLIKKDLHLIKLHNQLQGFNKIIRILKQS